MSAIRKNTDVSVTMTSTMAVVIHTSFQVGHVTFDTSWRTSSMNVKGISHLQPMILRAAQTRGRPLLVVCLLLQSCARSPRHQWEQTNSWQGRRVSNPQPSVLETDALPIELHPLRLGRPARERLHNVVRHPCHIFFLTRVRIGVWRPRTPESRPFSQVFQGDKHPLRGRNCADSRCPTR